MRAELSRTLERSLARHGISDAALGRAVGASRQKVGLWTDPESRELPSGAHIALMPRAVQVDLLQWLGAHAHVTIADDLAFDGDLSDHLKHLARLIEEMGAVTSTYAKALEDGVIEPQERRAMIEKLRASIAAQTALLRDFEGEEAARLHEVGRRVPRRVP